MRHLILFAVIVVSLAAIYVMMIRPYLRAMPSLADTWARIDDSKRTLGGLIWARLDGYKTFLWSRFLVLAGLLLPVFQAFEMVDLAAILPAKYAPYAVMGLALIGLVTEYLRRVTTKSLELAPPEPVKIEPTLDGPEVIPAVRPPV